MLQTAQSQDIADVRALKDNLAQIQFFVSSVGQYADGVAAAADGAHAAKDGSTQLVAGAQTLLNGANRLVDGTHQLHSGLNQFNEEGISQLTGALDPDQLHALKTVLRCHDGPHGGVPRRFLRRSGGRCFQHEVRLQDCRERGTRRFLCGPGQAAPAAADNFFVRL